MTTVRIPIHRQRHRGFNFAEVLFAVMILGIGFIMVAAMFPVAIQQSRASTNETVAARIADAAREILQANATAGALPQIGGTVQAPHDNLVRRIKNDLIFAADPRYGWTVLYQRGTADYARVFIVVMQVQNRAAYTGDDLINTSADPIFNPSTFQPIGVHVFTAEGDLGPDTIRFTDSDGNPVDPAAAAEGAVVIIRDDFREDDPATDFVETRGQLNGRVYRLGRRRQDIGTGVWELAPGHDMPYYAGSAANEVIHEIIAGPDPAEAWLIGRGHDNVGTGDPANFTGANQVIAVYQAIIAIP